MEQAVTDGEVVERQSEAEQGIHLVAPAGATRESLLSALPEDAPAAIHEGVAGFLEAAGGTSDGAGGPVLLAPDVPGDDVVRLLLALADSSHGWVPLLLRMGECGWSVLPLGAGFTLPAADAVERALDPGGDAPVLELRTVLRWVARARHDINNPLTAAMAEAQLLLMDVQDEEVRESVELIQEQLGRIRDLVARLQALKPSRPL